MDSLFFFAAIVNCALLLTERPGRLYAEAGF